MQASNIKSAKRVAQFELAEAPTSIAALPDNGFVVVCEPNTTSANVKLIKRWAPEPFPLPWSVGKKISTVAFDSGSNELLFAVGNRIHVCDVQGRYRYGHSVGKENEKITQLVVDGARGLVYVGQEIPNPPCAGRHVINVYTRYGEFVRSVNRPCVFEDEELLGWAAHTKLAICPDGKLVVADSADERVMVCTCSRWSLQ